MIAIYLLILISIAMTPAAKRIALITGANKGIGKEIIRTLGNAADVTSILGCRNINLGKAAVQDLQSVGCDVIMQNLDVTDSESINETKNYVTSTYGKLDILINNAALCYNDPTLYGKCDYTPFEKQARPTIETNFFGTLRVTSAMLPLLRASPSPRIINIASAAGRLSILKSKNLLKKFTSDSLTISELSSLMTSFIEDVEGGLHFHANKGWPSSCYGMSKLGIIALTKVIMREEPSMMVNCVDPGYCATDQNNNRGTLSPGKGAKMPAYLALMEASQAQFVSGKYFSYNGDEIVW